MNEKVISGLGEVNQPKERSKHQDIGFQDIIKFIYNSNPFYLISAALILYAQSILFKTDNITMETAIPVSLIAVYMLILSASAVFLVKVGKVWDDARSILFIILCSIFVLSVSLDDKAMTEPAVALSYLGGGLVFSVGICEFIRRKLNFTLPANFLGVYYAILGVLFSYPFIMARLVTDFPDDRKPLMYGVLLFPVVIGAVLLCLIPTVKKGRRLLESNGTAWKWPLFPWSIFAILALAACFRTYLLAVSFYPGKGVGPFSSFETGFAFYMVIPIILSIMILFLEFAIERKNKGTLIVAMTLPLAMILFAIKSGYHGLVYHHYLELIIGRHGNPLLFGFGAVTIFYLYAWLRKVQYAEYVFSVVIFAIMLADRKISLISSYSANAANWIVLIVIIALVWGAWVRKSALSLLFLLFGAITLSSVVYYNTAFTDYHGIIPIHLAFLATAVISAISQSALAQKIRYACSALTVAMMAAALFFGPQIIANISMIMLTGYCAVLLLLNVAAIAMFRKGLYFLVLTVNILLLAAKGCCVMLEHGSRGVNLIFWGIVFFLTAFSISMFKGGIIQQVFGHLKKYLATLQQSEPRQEIKP